MDAIAVASVALSVTLSREMSPRLSGRRTSDALMPLSCAVRVDKQGSTCGNDRTRSSSATSKLSGVRLCKGGPGMECGAGKGSVSLE